MTTAVYVFGFFLLTFTLVVVAVGVAGVVLRRSTAAAGDSLSILKDDNVSSISVFAQVLRGFNFVDVLRRTLDQAGLKWPVGRMVAMILLSGTLALVAALSTGWLPLLGVATVTVIGLLAPWLVVARKRSRRLRNFEDTFPDSLDSLCRALRAGNPFASAMETLATDAPPPVSTEIRKTIDEWKLGSSWEMALDHLAERVPITEVAVFSAAVKLQMRTGGRLGEVLTRLSETMREAVAVQGEVRALSAHGRMTGFILTLVPVAIAIMMFTVNPDHMRLLIDHPWGKNLITLAIACLILAHFVIRKIVSIRI